MKFLGILLVFVFTYGGLLVIMGLGNIDKFLKLMGVILTALPGEAMIIIGSAFAAWLIGNTSETYKATGRYFGAMVKAESYTKEDYTELLSVMFQVFKLARTKGWLALESHIENPEDSTLFGQFPNFQHNHHAITFFSDYLRIISLGTDDPHVIEALMDEEIENIAHHEGHAGDAMQNVADALPALGIVAAVLGVIKTMASISEPPEILGKMIGGALVGTFLGVWASYGFAGPIARAMIYRAETEVMYYKCMRVGIIAFLGGAAPQVSVEFARKFLPHNVQPSFLELEDHLSELPAPA